MGVPGIVRTDWFRGLWVFRAAGLVVLPSQGDAPGGEDWEAPILFPPPRLFRKKNGQGGGFFYGSRY